MKTGPDRKYTAQFRQAAVEQVEAGRSIRAVANSLEMSPKTLANWLYRSRKVNRSLFGGPHERTSSNGAASAWPSTRPPRLVEFLDELPKSTTGKILWRQLQ